MTQTLARTRNRAILGIVLIAAILAVGLNSSLVSADQCTAQLGYPVMATQQYYGSNVQVTVPVSATCYYQAGQLYAVGTAYDTTYNSNVGTANTLLSATYGGNTFSGQLQFNLPISAQTHSVQFSVSIYNTQTGYYQQYGGSLLTTTSETFLVTPGNYQNSYPYNPTYPTYPTYPSYPSYPNYPYNPGYNYYNGPYPPYNQNPGSYPYYSGHNQNPGYNYYHNGGYHNNNNPHCNNQNNYCHHP